MKWSQRARMAGAGGQADGRQTALCAGGRAGLAAGALSEKPDLTLHALLDELRRRRK